MTKISDWKNISEDEEYIYIGSVVTMTELCESELIKNKLTALYNAAYNLGSEQIRNKATIGGNIANASQSADTMLTMFSYGADIKIYNPENGFRIVPIYDVVIGREKTSLTKNEVICEIIIKKKNRISAFRKVGSRIAVTISKISCAMDLEMSEDVILNASVYLGAVGVKPVEAKLIEEEILNKRLNDIDITKIQELAFREIELAIPTRSSKYYKRIAIEGLVEDLLGDLK